MGLATLELLSRISIIGLDVLDMWDDVGVNADQLRADRQRARDAGHAYGEAEVLAAFERMGAAREGLDDILDLSETEAAEVVDPDPDAPVEPE